MMPILFFKNTLPFIPFSLFIALLICAMMLYFLLNKQMPTTLLTHRKVTNRKTKTGTIHEGQFQQQKEVFTLCNFKT